MIHPQDWSNSDSEVKGSAPAGRLRSGGLRGLLLILFCALSACEPDSTGPNDGSRLGASGDVTVRAVTPLEGGEGTLEQTILWSSSGAWALQERISYRGFLGDERVERNRGDPATLAPQYASFLRDLHESSEVGIFPVGLNPDLDPTCEEEQTRYHFRIRDDRTGEEREWVRCADGDLFTADPGATTPDPEASRVVLAGQRLRLSTVGPGAGSAYEGSLPFGSLDRGDDTPLQLDGPKVFRVPAGELVQTPPGWRDLWAEHTEGDRAAPDVDWGTEMVVVAAVGERTEAGDSVAVRRILREETSTRVEVVERRPGDFCSPAPRSQHPFHIVVAPRTSEPLRFVDVAVERVPCGI